MKDLDFNSLANYLLLRQLNLEKISKFKIGQSNPTFLIETNQGNWVLRKKPNGKLISKTAHNIAREYQILKALSDTRVKVPRPLFYCSDETIIGTEFYVMQFLNGSILTNYKLPKLDTAAKRKYYIQAVECLAELHNIDYSTISDLANFGKTGGFYSRQLKTLVAISNEQAKNTINLPYLQESIVWLEKNSVEEYSTIIHGDYKSDNIVYDTDKQEIVGILDWELSTIGHPFSDLSNLLLQWFLPVEYGGLKNCQDRSPPNDLPEAEELIRIYCYLRNIEYPIRNWDYCIAFSFLRATVILQGIGARLARSQATSANAAKFAAMAGPAALFLYDIVKKGNLEPIVSSKAKL